MNELLKKEFFGELGDTVGALRDLSVPSKGQARGHYLRSYKQGYDILKTVLGDMLRWDATLNGREVTRQLLTEHQRFIRAEINYAPKKALVKINNTNGYEVKTLSQEHKCRWS